MSNKKKQDTYSREEVEMLINDACIFMVNHAMDILASPVNDKPELAETMNRWIESNLKTESDDNERNKNSTNI